MPSPAAPTPLCLERQAGPVVAPYVLGSGGCEAVLGRSPKCSLVLNDDSVSRTHARLVFGSESWFLMDLESRHGTILNGVRLVPQRAAPVRAGDVIRIGPWAFRLVSPTEETDTRPTADDLSDARPSELGKGNGGVLAADRLRLLMDCASTLSTASNESEFADHILEAAIKGTGFVRGAVIRGGAGLTDVEVISSYPDRGVASGPHAFSRSLLRAAQSGKTVCLGSQAATTGNHGESIARLAIHSAVCAPIMLGSTAVCYLYLDARGRERAVSPEFGVFCESLSHLGSLALSALKRSELEKRQAQFDEDAAVARRAQRMILPPETGIVGEIEYAIRMAPGLTLAGDLFDVVPLSTGGTAVVLGDVSGKGVGAAITMAAVQSFLRSALSSLALADAVRATNQFAAQRFSDGQFVSLWVGVFDPRSRALRYVDAGHGWWMIRDHAGSARRVAGVGDIPIGIDPERVFTSGTEELSEGERVVVFSDGAVDQRAPDGSMFGVGSLGLALAGSTCAQTDVDQVFAAIRAHAQSWALTDDTTVASISRIRA